MPSDSSATWRVRIAFLCLFAVFAAGAWFVADLGRLQDSVSTQESRATLQGITDSGQIEEMFRKYPSSKFLQMAAMATRAADETTAAAEKLSNEVGPPSVSKDVNFAAASRADLEALRRDLKTAQANAEAFMPRFSRAAEDRARQCEEIRALAPVNDETIAGLLENIDKRHADMTAVTSKICRRAPISIAPTKTTSCS